jgi:hypothetical protein
MLFFVKLGFHAITIEFMVEFCQEFLEFSPEFGCALRKPLVRLVLEGLENLVDFLNYGPELFDIPV